MKWLQKKLRDFFGCTRGEVNGLIFLLFLLIVVVTLPRVFKLYLVKGNHLVNNKADIALLEDTLVRLEQQCEKTSQKKTKFDINQASVKQLQRLHGIGPKLAMRVIRYKKRLGGFVNKSQYEEIYGLSAKAIQNLLADSFITPNFIPNQLSINHCDYKVLSRHPYITYDMASRIINYRTKNGFFNSLDDLLSKKLLNAVIFKKVKPYLIVGLES